ncbi:MAG: chemotaxis protein CheW [Lentisphaerales bacterium]|nr:chemotaxis protein CheW [Lentisphaerales bacterium]
MSKVSRNFVIFKVNDLYCALDCLDVREIIRDTKHVKTICRSDQYISGVINLRGEIVSVMSLQKFFELKKQTKEQAIIVVTFDKEHIGFKISEILDVIEHDQNKVEACPTVPNGLKDEYINGVFEWHGELVTILSVKGIVSLEEVGVGA